MIRVRVGFLPSLPITEYFSVEFGESCISDHTGKAGSEVCRFGSLCRFCYLNPTLKWSDANTV